MTIGSVWHRPGVRPGLRSRAQFWKVLKAQGRCVSCWKPRDREGSLCVRCCRRARDAQRRKRGWDGTSVWQPKQATRGVRHYVGCSLPHADYLRLRQLAREDVVGIGTIVREAVQTYVSDVFGSRLAAGS